MASTSEDRMYDELCDVVRTAQTAGVGPKRFLVLTAEAWGAVHRDEIESANRLFNFALGALKGL